MPSKEQCVKCYEYGVVRVGELEDLEDVKLITDPQNPYCGAYLCGFCECDVDCDINRSIFLNKD